MEDLKYVLLPIVIIALSVIMKRIETSVLAKKTDVFSRIKSSSREPYFEKDRNRRIIQDSDSDFMWESRMDDPEIQKKIINSKKVKKYL